MRQRLILIKVCEKWQKKSRMKMRRFVTQIEKRWKRAEGIFRPSERVCFWDERGVVLGEEMAKFAMFGCVHL